MNDMLTWQEFEIVLNDQMIRKVQIYYQHTVDNNGVYPKGDLSNQFCSWYAKTTLASEDPNGDPIATPSICLYDILLNTKCDFFVTKEGRPFNSLFCKP